VAAGAALVGACGQLLDLSDGPEPDPVVDAGSPTEASSPEAGGAVEAAVEAGEGGREAAAEASSSPTECVGTGKVATCGCSTGFVQCAAEERCTITVTVGAMCRLSCSVPQSIVVCEVGVCSIDSSCGTCISLNGGKCL
jgi:hypothetical protein